ncbi:YdcH family protein [Faunimonas sp. B44]|uniref:YdcH family protein n=1 Tax=Faunimonas sp. B44 TaxID=3461493 RepID=UPI004043B934
MTDQDGVIRAADFAIRAELAQLRQEHRDLDSAIDALQDQPRLDNLQIQRLKKRKLLLKDRISSLEDKLLPDIIA